MTTHKLSRDEAKEKIAGALDGAFAGLRDQIAGELEDAYRHGGEAAMRSVLAKSLREFGHETTGYLDEALDTSMRGGAGAIGADVAGSGTREEDTRSLRDKLSDFSALLERTKVEIAQIHHPGQAEDRLASALFELDEIMSATERSTEAILQSAEKLSAIAEALQSVRESATEDGTSAQEALLDEVVQIFEACNFQDLTGQRIQKVVETLITVERRLDAMVKHMGRDAFSYIPLPDERVGDGENLTGPASHHARTRPDQAAIDDLFNS